MEARTLISEQEYLTSVYRPDCDYVDGELQERNLGEQDHGRLQKKLILYMGARERQWGAEVFPEQRVQVGPARFRVPDVCLVLGEPDGQVFRKPPFLCIEVLSPEDRLVQMRDRVDDYLTMGVPNVWVLDPQAKEAFTINADGDWHKVRDGILRTLDPVLEVPLSEVFE
jgi:Uma2 family endonuclease